MRHIEIKDFLSFVKVYVQKTCNRKTSHILLLLQILPVYGSVNLHVLPAKKLTSLLPPSQYINSTQA